MSPRPKVLLVGSSIFRDWGQRAAEAFPASDVTNAAIGGTQTVDWLPQIEAPLAEHRPDVLCVYCGSNDLSNARPAEEIAENLAVWRAKVEAFDPAVTYTYFSIIKCPEKARRHDAIDTVHQRVRADARPGDRFVDLNPVFFVDGRHPPGLFVEDGVHLTRFAYDQMAQTTREQLAGTGWV